MERWIISEPRTIELGTVHTLKVALVAGRVDIVAHDEPTALVEVSEVIGRDLLVSIDGGTLTVDHPQLRWDNFWEAVTKATGRARADVSIRVPRGIDLKLSVVSANALVWGTHGPAAVNTVSGPVVLDAMEGDLTVNSVSGEVTIRDHRGTVNVKTVGGDVTTSGEIPALAVNTVSGDLFADLTGPTDRIDVNTVSGDILIRLPEGQSARYRISSARGIIRLDDNDFTGSRGQMNWVYGPFEGAWTDVAINTASGKVSVVHQSVDTTADATTGESA